VWAFLGGDGELAMGLSIIPPGLNNGAEFNGPPTLGVAYAILSTDGAGNTFWVPIPSLPTSDPNVAGRLWNSSGVMMISAGFGGISYSADSIDWTADSVSFTVDVA
jgi:hypothetical protein